MTARRTLIDAGRQRAHGSDARIHLLPEQHAAAARFRALTDHDFNRVGTAHVVRVEAITRRQALIDQCLRRAAFLLRHAAVAGGGRGAHGRGGLAECFFHVRGQRAEAHAGDRDRNVEHHRFFGKARAEHRLRRAFLAIPFERIARKGGTEKQQIVEMRHAAFRAQTANFIEAALRGGMDIVDRLAVIALRLFLLQAGEVNGFGFHGDLLRERVFNIPGSRRRSSGRACEQKRSV
jgi:hypothetical protein